MQEIQDLSVLKPGDVVRGRLTGNTFVVVKEFDGVKAIAVHTQEVFRPSEWELIEYSTAGLAKAREALSVEPTSDSTTTPPVDTQFLLQELSKRDRVLGRVEAIIENLNLPDYNDRQIAGDLLKEIASLYTHDT